MSISSTMPRSVYANKLGEFVDFAFADVAVFSQRGRWREFFGGRIGPAFNGRIVLEIGCSNAAFLLRIAAEHPDIAFVGIDWKCKAIYDGAKEIAEQGLRNIALLRARGHELHRIFGEAELDEIWIFHPDPCEREPELKNRLVSEQFLAHAHAALCDPSSFLALKTDHEGYYQSVIDLLSAGTAADAHSRAEVQKHFTASIRSTDYWNDPQTLAGTASHLFAGKRTLFENRFIRKRIAIRYVEMRKCSGQGQPPRQPEVTAIE